MVKKIIILLLLFFISCNRYYKEKFLVAGTYLEVISDNKDAIRIVFDEAKRLDKIFNFYNQESELYKLNSSYNLEFQASEDLIKVLILSKYFNDITDKAFDVSYGVLYDFWKDLIKKETKELPDKEKILELKKLGGMENIEINNNKVLIKKEGLKIDLGAIAKGYIVDKIISIAKNNNIKNLLINLGGEIYCLGEKNKRSWSIGIGDPENKDNIIKILKLKDKAIATSGNYEQFFKVSDRVYSHLIDPRTGFPIENNILSVSVVADNCTLADALSTAFFIMGLDKTKEFLLKNNFNIKVFIIIREDNKDKLISLNG